MVVVKPSWRTATSNKLDTHSFYDGCDSDSEDKVGPGEGAMVSLMGSSRFREMTEEVLQACSSAQHARACQRAEKKGEA